MATGVYLSGHPLDEYMDELKDRQVNIYKILLSQRGCQHG